MKYCAQLYKLESVITQIVDMGCQLLPYQPMLLLASRKSKTWID